MAINEYMTEWSLLTAEKHGRLVVSGGDTVSEFYEPDVDLATIYIDETHKPFLECVMTKGTFITLETKTTGAQDNKTVATICDGRTEVVQGLLVLDAMRPFANGDKTGVSFITEGYVEFPIIESLNSTVVVGSKIAVDQYGRPVVWDATTEPGGSGTDTHSAAIGVVKAIEIIGTDEFDTGMLEYMALPYEEFENALIRATLTITDTGSTAPAGPLFGYRSNLDVTNVLGAMRVQLYKL